MPAPIDRRGLGEFTPIGGGVAAIAALWWEYRASGTASSLSNLIAQSGATGEPRWEGWSVRRADR